MSAQQDKQLYQDVGKLVGLVEGMDKRLTRMEKKQDDLMKKTTRNSVVCAGVLSVTTSLVVNQLKSYFGLPLE